MLLAAQADCLWPRSGIRLLRLQTLKGCCCAGVVTYVKERFSPLAARADCLDGGESDLDREGRRAPQTLYPDGRLPGWRRVRRGPRGQAQTCVPVRVRVEPPLLRAHCLDGGEPNLNREGRRAPLGYLGFLCPSFRTLGLVMVTRSYSCPGFQALRCHEPTELMDHLQKREYDFARTTQRATWACQK